MLASFRDHIEIAQALLVAGANKDAANNNGRTALMIASSYGHSEIVALLKASTG
jgi:ankyrin repeat protein